MRGVKRIAWLAVCLPLAFSAAGAAASEQEHIDRALEYLEQGDGRAAIIELKNAVQANPQNAEARMMLGELYLQSGDAPDAVKELQRARDLGRNDDRLRLLLAQARLLTNDFQAVIDDIPRDQPLADDIGAGLLAARGQALFGIGRFDEAEATLKRVVAERPVASAYHGLARMALFQRDPGTAGKFISEGLAKFPDDTGLEILKGEQQLQIHDFAGARATFERLESENPYNLAAAIGLVRSELALNRPEPARLLIDDLLARFPGSYALKLLRAIASLQAKDYLAAQSEANEVRAIADDNVAALYVSGAASYGLGHYEQAAQALQRYVALAPNDPAGRKLLAATQVRLGNPDAARAALGNPPETADVEYLALLGATAALSGDVASGLQYLEQAVLQSPEDARLRAQLGMMRIAAGDTAQGELDLSQALELDPGLANDPRYESAEITLIQGYLREAKFDEALAAIETWKSRHPGDKTGLVMEGVALAGKGDEAGARAAFDRALEMQPGAPDASANLAILDIRAGDLAGAEEILQRSLDGNPDDLRILLLLAQVAEKSGARDKTRDWLERTVKAHPDNPSARIFLARLYFSQGEPDKALDAIEPVLRTAPDNVAALEVAARSRMQADRISEAVSTYERLVQKAPDVAQPRLELAQAYRLSGDPARARRSAEAALAIAPDDPTVRHLLAELLIEQSDATAAEPIVANLESDFPNIAEVKTLRARLTLLQGDVAGALAHFQAARQIRDSTDLVIAVARTQYRLGELDAAIQTLEDWIARQPQDIAARLELHGYYLADGQEGPAEANLRQVLAHDPDAWIARNNLAWMLYARGDAAAALPEAERANELAPDNPVVMDTLGVVLLELGETERALRLIRRAADRLPDNPQVAYHLARAYAQADRKDEAREILTAVLAKHQSFDERDRAEALLTELGG